MPHRWLQRVCGCQLGRDALSGGAGCQRAGLAGAPGRSRRRHTGGDGRSLLALLHDLQNGLWRRVGCSAHGGAHGAQKGALLLDEEVELVGFGEDTAGGGDVEEVHQVPHHQLRRLSAPGGTSVGGTSGGGSASPDMGWWRARFGGWPGPRSSPERATATGVVGHAAGQRRGGPPSLERDQALDGSRNVTQRHGRPLLPRHGRRRPVVHASRRAARRELGGERRRKLPEVMQLAPRGRPCAQLCQSLGRGQRRRHAPTHRRPVRGGAGVGRDQRAHFAHPAIHLRQHAQSRRQLLHGRRQL
mmetsp:Transcript_31599/g.100715  ORF Transcript_31599/g.100715 Transcript_31599/m.100715 type:complete len:301 (+) Transcript_31599:3262-4164(+)